MNMKEQLKDGYTVVYRNGDERMVKGDELYFEGAATNLLNRYNDDLNISNVTTTHNNDIISIRNENNVEIWKREGEEWVDLREEQHNSEEEHKIDLDAAEEMKKLNNSMEELNHSGSDHVERPPLGITPRFILRGRRIEEICKAIIRYNNADIDIPEEWIDELNDLI
jgi:predicted phosphohydrolase